MTTPPPQGIVTCKPVCKATLDPQDESGQKGRSRRRRRCGTTFAVLLLLGGASAVHAATVTGKVKDSVSGALLSGVTVKVTQQSSRSATTNSSGVYSITSVSAGTVTLTASKSGYVTQVTGNLTVPSSGTVTAPDILLVKVGTITGTVVNASGGAAVASATVTVTGTSTSTTTSSAGTFTLSYAPGICTLTVSKSGWKTTTTAAITVTSGQTTNVGNISLTQLATVTGKVKDAGSGSYISGVVVTLQSDPAVTATTASTGTYTLSNVPVGTQTLVYSKAGYLTKTSSPINVVAGTNTLADVSLSRVYGSVAGTVTDAQAANAALPGATVTVTGSSPAITATTATDGSFVLANVPVGSVTLTVSKTNYANLTSGSLSVSEGQTTPAGTLALNRTTVTVSGTVKTSSGTAISGATVTVAEQAGKTATTTSTGSYTLSGVYWGTVHVTAAKSGYGPSTQTLTLQPGTNATCNFTLVAAVGTISGTVTDAQAASAALPGATVTVTGSSPAITATTATDGSFVLANVPVGTVTLTVSKTNYTNLTSGSLAVSEGQTTPAGTLALNRTTVTVSGTVKTSSGAGISGATVTVEEQAGKTTTTTSTGSYTLSGVYWGTVHVTAAKSGYGPSTQTLTLQPGTNATCNFTLGAGVGTITGTITDAQNGGAGLGGATVKVNSVTPVISATTASDGTYTLAGVPVGTRTVNASAASYVAADSGNITVTQGTPSNAGALALNRTTVAVSGTVTDTTSGAAVSGALVTVQEQLISTWSSSSGFYSILNPPGVYWGSIHLVASATNYVTKTVPVTLTAGIDKTQNIALDHLGSITGTVVNGANGAPVVGVTVTVTGTGNSVLTDAMGRFTSGNLTSGTYRLALTKEGWVSATTGDLTVTLNQTTNAGTIPLYQNGTLHGTVVNASGGAPLEGVTVTVTDTSNSTTTDPLGQFTLLQPAGNYTLTLTKTGWVILTTTPLIVSANQTAEAGTISLAQEGTIHGTVAPAYYMSEAPSVAVTDTSAVTFPNTQTGEFTVNVGPGTYTLKVSGTYVEKKTTDPIVVTSAQTTEVGQIALTLFGHITGRVVTDVSGADLPGATVAAPSVGKSVTIAGCCSGSFDLYLPAGNHLLVVSRPGWLTRTIGPFAVTAGQGTQVPGNVVVLTPGGMIEGTVVNAAEGSRVPGANVALDGTTFATTADDAGAFTLSPPTGSYTLTVTKAGWAAATIPAVSVATGQSTSVGLVQLAQQSGVLSGTVLSVAGGSPVESAVVCIAGTSVCVNTDASGVFSLAHLTGPWWVTVRKAGWASAASGPFAIEAGKVTPVGMITLSQPAGTLAGSAIVGVPGTPADGAVVTAEGTAISTVADTAGSFEISLAPGFYTLSVSKGFGRGESPILLASEGQSTSAGTIALSAAEGAVAGSVIDSVSSAPVASATVSLRVSYPELVLTTTTDANGRFALVGPAGSYTLTVSKISWWFPAPSFTPTIVAGQTTELGNVGLMPHPQICGKIVDSRGYPVAGASISGPGGWSGDSVVDGTFLMGANPGTGPLTVTKSGYSTLTTAPITVSPGFVVDAGVLTLQKYGSIHGRVDSTTGEGVGDGTVTVDGTGIVTGTVSSLNCWPMPICEGQYIVSAPAGTYTLTVARTGYVTKTTAPVTFTDGVDAILNVTLEPAPGYNLASLTVAPAAVRPGESATGTVTLDGPAPPIPDPLGLFPPSAPEVYLTSSDASVTVPTSVVIPIGTTSATFTITTSPSASVASATIKATYLYSTRHKEAVLTLIQPKLTGLAPGWVLPGASNVVAYGAGFNSGSSVELSGPVYALGNYTTQLCNLSLNQCPTLTLPATANAAGTALSFAVPQNTGPGVYLITGKTSDGIGSSNSTWLAVDAATKSYPVLPPEQHMYAKVLYSGQTATGTFAAGGDTTGRYADFNAYYFLATAGSTVDVTLDRVDTSKPWEHPDSLDPQLEIVAPDGFVPQNLVAFDNQPGVDLNASLHSAVLPLTGIYVVYAATTRGFGDYRLHFAITSMAPAPVGERVFPIADSFATVPIGQTTTPTAIVLDPRGCRVSGATVTFATASNADDHGTVEFTGGTTVLSGPDGSVQTTVTAQGIGKVSFAPAFVDSFATSLGPDNAPADISGAGAGLASAREAARPIPRYQAVARQAITVSGFYADGSIRMTVGSYERLPIERRHARRETQSARSTGAGSGIGPAQVKQEFTAVRAPQQPADPGSGPLDASTAVPLPEVEAEAEGMTAQAQAITSCGQATFIQGIVPAGTQLHPPFTATLTDLTPSTGQTQPNGEVGVDGIHGHRIEKTARVKIGIRDSTGAEPAYPVLVQLAVGGPRHGTLILDPDGSALECTQVAFLWHDRDAQGNLIAANEEFGYRMGTYAAYVGVTADPGHPGQVVPVWGTAEALGLSAQAKVQINDQWADPFLMTYGVHPEPGKPDHFASFDLHGRPEDNRFEYWSDYLINPANGGLMAADRRTIENVYVLTDRYGNTTYGFGATSSTSSRPNVTVEFADQLADGPDHAAYTMATSWTDAGGMPDGEVPATLTVTYPGDSDWGVGPSPSRSPWCSNGGASTRSWRGPPTTTSSPAQGRRGTVRRRGRSH